MKTTTYEVWWQAGGGAYSTASLDRKTAGHEAKKLAAFAENVRIMRRTVLVDVVQIVATTKPPRTPRPPIRHP